MSDKLPLRSSCRAAQLSAVAIASIVAASVIIAAAPLHAASYSWAVSVGNWSVASNWGGTVVPTSEDSAYIARGGTASITSAGAVCQYLYLGDPNSANTGTITMSGGSLSVPNEEYLGNLGTGTFGQSAGTNNAGEIYLAYGPGSSGNYNLNGAGVIAAAYEWVGWSGSGSFVQS